MGYLIQFLISLAVTIYMSSRMKAKNTLEAETFEVTTAEEGGTLPIIHGTAWTVLRVVWYGNKGNKAIKQKTGSFFGIGGSKQTTGYQYFCDIHAILCLGRIDSVRKILVDTNRVVFEGALAGANYKINAPKLYGQAEGGLQGYISLLNGGFGVRPVKYQGEYAPLYKGMTSFLLHAETFETWVGGSASAPSNPFLSNGGNLGFYHGNSGYLKEFKVLVQNIDQVYVPFVMQSYRKISETVSETVFKKVLFIVDDNYNLNEESRALVKTQIMNILEWYNLNGTIISDFGLAYGSRSGGLSSRTNFFSDGHGSNVSDSVKLEDWETALDSLRGDSWGNGIGSTPFSNLAALVNRSKAFLNDTSTYPAGAEIEVSIICFTRGLNGYGPENYVAENVQGEFAYLRSKGSVYWITIDEGHMAAPYPWNENQQYLSLIAEKSKYISLASSDQSSAFTEALEVVKSTGGKLAFFSLNPAVMIYDALHNSSVGSNILEADIDLDSFVEAARQLFLEGFGLSFNWNNEARIFDYIEQVRAHIGAVLYEERTTGKWTLKLIRGDYDVEDLPHYDESTISSVSNFERQAYSDRINQITLKFKDLVNDKTATVTVQDPALLSISGKVNAKTVEYMGIVSRAIANRVALRDLRQASSGLVGLQITMPYLTAKDMRQGDVFRVSWVQYGLEEMIMRVSEIDFGTSSADYVTINAIQDIFALPSAGIVTEETDFGGAEQVQLANVENAELIELSRYMAERNEITTSAYGTLAIRPNEISIGYMRYLAYGNSLDYQPDDQGPYCPFIRLQVDLSKSANSITTELYGDLAGVELPNFIYINEEVIRVNSASSSGETLTLSISRGAEDAVPRNHSSGAVGYFLYPYLMPMTDPTQTLTGGDVVKAIFTNMGASEETDIPVALTKSLTIGDRYAQPLPPTNVKINDIDFPTDLSGDVTLTWTKSRNYSVEDSYAWGDLVPTTGYDDECTYAINIIRNSASVYTVSGLTSDSHLIPETSLPEGNITIELWSEKAGKVSFQKVSHVLAFSKSSIPLTAVVSARGVLGSTISAASLTIDVDESLSANFTAEQNGENSIVGKAPAGATITIEIED